MAAVSVIVPTYNRASLIRHTLDSVFAQTFTDYQLIVVDDGSDDDTPQVMAALGNPVEYHRIDHAGPGAARNAGLQQARGAMIAFLDSDDLWSPCFLETMLAALERTPSAGFAYCDYATFDDRGTLQPACHAPDKKIEGDLFPKMIEGDFICTGSLLIRQACLQRTGGFDPTLPVAQDWDLWLRLTRTCQGVYVDEPLLSIRFHDGHISRDPELMFTCNLRIMAKLRHDFPEEAHRYRSLVRRTIMRNHRWLFGHYRRNGRPLAALKHLCLLGISSVS